MKFRLRPELAAGVPLLVILNVTVPAMADDGGFLRDSQTTLNLRNFYINRNYVDPTFPQGKAEEWTQSFILNAKSGFTPGPVGFGVDVIGMSAFKLDGGGGTSGTQLLPTHDDGNGADQFGRLAIAAKARVAKTDIRVGEWMPILPVLRTDDGRSLPQTFQGAQVTSKDLPGLTLNAGQMRAVSLRNSSDMQDMSFNGAFSDRFNFAGADWAFNNDKSSIGVWYAQLSNVYNQRYFNFQHLQVLGDWALGANLVYFDGENDGSSRAGKLDNQTASALLSAKTGPHSFYVGLQRLSGASNWMRITGTSGGTVANDSFNSDFENAKERSWQVRYDFNFVAVGIPGLVLMNRYIRGSNALVGLIKDGTERDRESELSYVVQSGSLRKLSVTWRNSSIRRSYSNNEFDENRLIFNYPISLF
jgi:hypothetical protein